MDCAVHRNVGCRIDALFIATETPRNFAAGCQRVPRARKDASRDSAFARCFSAILPNISRMNIFMPLTGDTWSNIWGNRGIALRSRICATLLQFFLSFVIISYSAIVRALCRYLYRTRVIINAEEFYAKYFTSLGFYCSICRECDEHMRCARARDVDNTSTATGEISNINL